MINNNLNRDLKNILKERATDAYIDQSFGTTPANQIKHKPTFSKKGTLIALVIAIIFVVGFEIISPGSYPFTLAICGLFLAHQLLEYFM